MNFRIIRKHTRSLLAFLAVSLSVAAPTGSYAQGARGAPAPQTPQQAQAVDMTGYWVSVVTEDWRVRMVTPPKGYYESVPMTAESKKVADAWDPAKDEAAGNQCKGYGVGGILRQPGRVHITWADPTTLKMDLDAGTQTRSFRFGAGAPPAAGAERSWQGNSVASWDYAPTGRGNPRKGSLKVVTTGMRAGYVRKNGVPYSENAVVTEYYDVININGEQWLVVTQEVADPLYFNPPFITSTQYKKQADASGWNPTACSAR